MSLVEKRCACGEARWTKCRDPWYLKTMEHQGKGYSPNLTRYALVVLNRPTLTTKTEADEVADLVRAAIRAGTYVSAKHHRPAAPSATLGLTLDVIAAKFETACINADATKRANSKANDRAILKRLCAHRIERGRLGALDMATISVDDLVAFRSAYPFANSTWNKYRTLCGQLWRWARWSEYLREDIFTVTPPALLKRLRRSKPAQRNRRVSDEEFANVLEAATEARYQQAATRLYAIILAAIETGCRVGELLALQWGDVHLDRREWFVRAEEVGGSKTGVGRIVELSIAMLHLLPSLRKDPAGHELPRAAYVFGDEYGGRVKSIDKAWGTAVLRAHNVEPVWTAQGDFDPASRAELHRIDLHIHDLRHEAGNRMLESGCFNLEEIRQRYGHANLSQTSTYLHASTGSTRVAQANYDKQRQQLGTIPVSTRHKVGTNGIAIIHPRLNSGSTKMRKSFIS